MTPEETKVPDTAPQAGDAATKASLFTIALQMINDEGQIIWGRFSAMLTANAFFGALVGAAFTREPVSEKEAIVVMLVSVVGWYLCWLWFQLVGRGWAFQKHWKEYIETIKWDGLVNPHDFVRKKKPLGLGIAALARRVIYVFFVVYFLSFVYAAFIISYTAFLISLAVGIIVWAAFMHDCYAFIAALEKALNQPPEPTPRL